MTNFLKQKKGFTLVEMLVAISLFVIVVFISIGAIMSIFSANGKARASKSVVDNLNYTVENMVRNIRFGGLYHCGSSGNLSTPANCSNGDTSLALRLNGNTIVYRRSGARIEYSSNGGSSYVALTPPEVVITNMLFYVLGASNSDQLQPYVVIVIKGYVGNRPTTQTVFSLQTFVSQRELDL